MDYQTLLLFAQLLANTTGNLDQLPDSWSQADHYYRPQNGTEMNVYTDGNGQAVLAIRGANQLRDILYAPWKRAFGYSDADLAYARQVAQQYPNLEIIGHSAGGGLASWLGNQLNLPTVTFNAGRPPAATEGTGTNQTNVAISGDIWGDPQHVRDGGVLGGPLPGNYVYLNAPNGISGLQLHRMPTILAALEGAVQGR